MRALRSVEALLIPLCVLLAHGCADGGTKGAGDGRARAEIGPEGGTVEVTDPESALHGVRLTIPAGAVAERTTFSIAFAPNPPALPAGLSADHPAVTFAPGATFARSVELTFPVTYVPTGEGDLLGAYCWSETKGRWVVTPARRVDEGKRVVVATHEVGLCRWGTIRLSQVEDDTVRAWMEDMQSMFDDWAELEAALRAELEPFIAIVENPISFHRCDRQAAALSLLGSWRQAALAEMTAYLQSTAVVNACSICDRGGACLPSVCDAGHVISGQPIAWLQSEIQIYMEELFFSAACPIDVLGPVVGKMVAWAKYQEAIRELACDWRCILKNGTPEFYGSLLLGNVCSFGILAIDLYRQHYGCSG